MYVNNQLLKPEEIYENTHWELSFNPWLILLTHFIIRNRGITSIGSITQVNTLYVSGYVNEGWFPNPLGLIILCIGLWLFIQGKKK